MMTTKARSGQANNGGLLAKFQDFSIDPMQVKGGDIIIEFWSDGEACYADLYDTESDWHACGIPVTGGVTAGEEGLV